MAGSCGVKTQAAGKQEGSTIDIPTESVSLSISTRSTFSKEVEIDKDGFHLLSSTGSMLGSDLVVDTREIGINVTEYPEGAAGVGITVYELDRTNAGIECTERDIAYFTGEHDFPWWFTMDAPTVIEFSHLR